jgi:two-component sensor histidine kinase
MEILNFLGDRITQIKTSLFGIWGKKSSNLNVIIMKSMIIISLVITIILLGFIGYYLSTGKTFSITITLLIAASQILSIIIARKGYVEIFINLSVLGLGFSIMGLSIYNIMTGYADGTSSIFMLPVVSVFMIVSGLTSVKLYQVVIMSIGCFTSIFIWLYILQLPFFDSGSLLILRIGSWAAFIMLVFLSLIIRNAMTRLGKVILDKEYLMREVHHRVKNNLTIILSLINLKSHELEDKSVLSDLRHQINSILLIHEDLYKGNDLAHIRLRAYLERLLTSVFSSLFIERVKMVNNIDEDLILKTKNAVIIGLIVNEIATNSIKHGFEKDVENIFTIDMYKENRNYHLTISNNGKPFPEDIELGNTTTLGLQLIYTLVSQLDGSIELIKSPHPKYIIKFPED